MIAPINSVVSQLLGDGNAYHVSNDADAFY